MRFTTPQRIKAGIIICCLSGMVLFNSCASEGEKSEEPAATEAPAPTEAAPAEAAAPAPAEAAPAPAPAEAAAPADDSMDKAETKPTEPSKK
ncbi:MAG: hypothetical protein JNM44_05015 [Chitinophagaceae bacterium]|nr:hypothetical protein [Chitinophagaceae bacterium]